MFFGVIVTRQYAWEPSSGAVGANEFDLGTSNDGLEGADLEEGNGDSEENVNQDFENHICRGVGGVHMSTSSNKRVVAKEKKESTRSRELERKSHLELVLN